MKKRVKHLLDYLAGTIVILRDKRCVLCGKLPYAAHHIWAKSKGGNVRWDLRNLIAICKSCHIFCVHRDPERYRQKIIEHVDGIYGVGTYELLRARANMASKVDLQLEELYLFEHLKKYTDINKFKLLSYTGKLKLLKQLRSHI